MITANDFVAPTLQIAADGAVSIAPRQRIKKGQIVLVEYHRRSSAHDQIPNLGPKGKLFARVVEVPAGAKYLMVRILATKSSVYGGVRAPHVSNRFTVRGYPKRACTLLHPGGPDADRLPSAERVPAEVYTIIHGCIKETAKARLWERLYGLTPAAQLELKSRNNRDYLERAAREWKSARNGMLLRTAADNTSYHQHTLQRICREYNTKSQLLSSDGRAFAKMLASASYAAALSSLMATVERGGMSSCFVARRAAVLRKAEQLGVGVYHNSCHHFHESSYTYVTRRNTYSQEQRTVCLACGQALVEQGVIREYEGEMYDTRYCRFYTWEDGVERPTAPPPVIGSYHSSKQYFSKPMPNPDGSMSNERPYLGVELEFVTASNATRTNEDCARSIKRAVARALPWVTDSRPYCLFERDGSVDFEMVTGYGPIATHREALIAAFSGNPYTRDLRSHDGGRCGIHVHLDKPKSLLHAVKLQKFWNDPDNIELIESVARRYNAGYASAVAGKADIKRVAKDLLGYGSSQRQSVTDEAMRRLNDAGGSAGRGSRYVLCNFHNERTVELRGFRGTLRLNTMLACLEFALMTWYFSRDSEPHKLGTHEFLEYISAPHWRHETRYLRAYLSAKNYAVWMPRVRAVDAVVSK